MSKISYILAVVAINALSCRAIEDSNLKIIGGKVAQSGQFEQVVAISTSENFDDFYCSGSLIHPRVVITAGHCVIGQNPEKLNILFGVQDNDPEKTINKVEAVANHPYPPGSTTNDDIGFVILNKEVSGVTPLKILTDPFLLKSKQRPGDEVWIAGFDQDENGSY